MRSGPTSRRLQDAEESLSQVEEQGSQEKRDHRDTVNHLITSEKESVEYRIDDTDQESEPDQGPKGSRAGVEPAAGALAVSLSDTQVGVVGDDRDLTSSPSAGTESCHLRQLDRCVQGMPPEG